MSYADFLASKAIRAKERGLVDVPQLAGHLFPFQRSCVDFALRAGSAGNFLSTGLGKTACELEWSAHAAEATNGKALIMAPLSVGWQIAKEAERWGYAARVIRDQSEAADGINICNYDRLDKLEPAAFGAVALDESSILKSFGGKTSRALIGSFADHRFRLSATATPAPNDHMELGQQSDFLGVMPSSEMLMRWFINDTSTASQEWRLKKHAVNDFWDWCASWSRMAEMPSDLGGDDTGFVLPPMKIIRHRAEASPIKGSDLFGMVDMSATSMFDVKRKTAVSRAKMAFETVMGETWHGSRNTPPTDASVARLIRNLEQGETSRETSAPSKAAAGNTKSGETKTPSLSLPNALPMPLTETPSGEIGINQTRITAKKQRMSPKNATLTKSETLGSSFNSASAQMTTPLYLNLSVEDARSAGPSNQTGEDGGSTLIIATQPEKSGDFSVPGAILVSENSKTAMSGLLQQRPTSGPDEFWVVWCDTDFEQDELEKLFGNMAISIKGSMTADTKEYLHNKWVSGDRKILITKVSIFGYGMNWQHCARTAFVGRTFSYEAWYQAVRRFWRFGQKREVEVHLIVAEGEEAIARVIDRKADDHVTMKTAMRAAMLRATEKSATRKTSYAPSHKARAPAWA